MPRYERPSWESVKEEVNSCPSVAAKINYLNRVLTTDQQEVDFLTNKEAYPLATITYGEGGTIISGVDPHILAMEQEKTDSFRNRIESELDYWQNRLSEEPITQAQLEKSRENEIERIQWTGSKRGLVNLFEKLIEEGLIAPSYKYDTHSKLAPHFSDANGEPITNKQLNAAKSQAGTNVGKIRDEDAIDRSIAAAKDQSH